MDFIRRLALQEKKNVYDSPRLDVVEIARAPDMFPSLFLLPGEAKDLSAPRYNNYAVNDPLITSVKLIKQR